MSFSVCILIFISAKQSRQTACNFCIFRVSNETRGQSRPLVSFYDVLIPLLILRIRCVKDLKAMVAISIFEESEFLAEL